MGPHERERDVVCFTFSHLKIQQKIYIQTGLNTTYMFMILPLPVIINKGIFLFNDALNTFYLRLYGVRHMVKDHSYSEKGNPLPPHRLLFPISSKGSFICTIPQTG